jgi:hypothetical protein
MDFIFSKLRRACLRSIPMAAVVAAFVSWLQAARAVNFVEPPVFASSRGVLDLLIIVIPQPVPSINYMPPGGGANINPTGLVYQICPRKSAGQMQCPAGSATTSYYGGIRLALQKGDQLKFRLINRLPPIPYQTLANLDDGMNLPMNPTNIHTHGMVVQARAPTVSNPTFGDDIFVEIYNSQNGTPDPNPHSHGAVRMDSADYQIDVPSNHPSGLFWFHPHVHGIAVNQVSGGMAGIITVGKVGDYAFSDVHDARPFPEANVRYLVLKDMQVLAAGTYNFANGTLADEPGGPHLLHAISGHAHRSSPGILPRRQQRRRQRLHRRNVVPHRQRAAVSHHPDYRAGRRNLAAHQCLGERDLRSAADRRRDRDADDHPARLGGRRQHRCAAVDRPGNGDPGRRRAVQGCPLSAAAAQR